MPDAHKNFAYSTVATAPSPAASGTSLVVASGEGANFPTPPFNVTIWPVSTQPTNANAEIVRVTAISTDTLTITRTQESTSARTVVVGDQIAATLTQQIIELAEWAAAKYAIVETEFAGNSLGSTSTASGGAASHVGASWGAIHPGLMRLTSGTTGGGYAVVLTSSANNSADFSSDDELTMEFIVKTPSTVSDVDMRFGLGVQNTGNPNWGYWIEKLAADTNFFFKVMNNGTADTRQDTGAAVSASTWYSIKLRRASGVYYWSINRVAENAGYTATNNPGGGQAGHVFAAVLVNGTASSRTLDVDYMRAEGTGSR